MGFAEGGMEAVVGCSDLVCVVGGPCWEGGGCGSPWEGRGGKRERERERMLCVGELVGVLEKREEMRRLYHIICKYRAVFEAMRPSHRSG